MITKPNIETRISNRAKSVFAAFGQVVNDFYLEAGIYFVGGFNAALVSWNIYTDLLADNQPPAYAVTIAIIAFIAVEGLAVYLVGAAAKTNNGLLWVFSVIFAGFFTYAHYQEMVAQAGIIAQYITLAIPFFVVVGYWARTVKVDVENRQALADKERDNEAARQRQLEDEERQRQQDIEAQRLARKDEERQRRYQLEDEERRQRQEIEAQNSAHKLEMERVKEANKQTQKLAQLEGQSGQKGGQMDQMNRQDDTFGPANWVKETKKVNRQNELVELVKIEPGMGPTELTKRLNEMGYTASVSTIKRDIKALNGKAK